MEERCIICGSIIPEGRQVCPLCERGERNDLVDDFSIFLRGGIRRDADCVSECQQGQITFTKEGNINEMG